MVLGIAPNADDLEAIRPPAALGFSLGLECQGDIHPCSVYVSNLFVFDQEF
jgi:hypothetical protein